MFIKHLFCQITSSCASALSLRLSFCISATLALRLSTLAPLAFCSAHRHIFSMRAPAAGNRNARCRECTFATILQAALVYSRTEVSRYGAVPYARHPPHSFASMPKIVKPLYIV